MSMSDNFFISDSRHNWEEAAVWAGGGAGHHQDLLHLPWRQLGVQTGKDWPGLRQVRCRAAPHIRQVDRHFEFKSLHTSYRVAQKYYITG